MSYRRTILMGGHFLLEVMSYGRIGLIEEHGLLEACFRGRNVLQEDVFLDNI